MTFENVRVGKAAAVLLDDPDAIPQSAGAIHHLPENLFPPHSTATDCLAAVAIDHVPKWDPARQKSFVEWLQRGGRVYLLLNADNRFPEFTGELQVLNLEAAKQRVGSGTVHRVERFRRQLDAPFVEQVIVAGVEPGGESAAELPKPEPPKPADSTGNYKPLNDYGFINIHWDPEATFLTNLKAMSQPDHNWVLIHFLALVYLGLVCPGCLAVGKRFHGDFRATFGFLLGTVLVFSLAFLLVGRRGYNESTVVHSVAVARQSQAGTLDVTQWSNAFVIHSGDYILCARGVRANLFLMPGIRAGEKGDPQRARRPFSGRYAPLFVAHVFPPRPHPGSADRGRGGRVADGAGPEPAAADGPQHDDDSRHPRRPRARRG